MDLPCQLCQKTFKTPAGLKKHYLRKTACIKDVGKWKSEKEALSEAKIKPTLPTFNIQQTNFLTKPLQSMKLLGIPGGGKTRTIIGYILSLYNRDLIKESKEILVVTFSRRARNDFVKKGKQSFAPLFNLKNIRTIHSIAASLMKDYLQKSSSSLGTIVMATYQAILKNELNVSQSDLGKNLKVIIVDEAQDISEVQYLFLQAITHKLKIPLVMVGDPNQNIYQFQSGSDKFLIEHPGDSIFLTQNYRSSQEILDFLNYLRPWKDYAPAIKSATGKSGKKPIIVSESPYNLLKHLINTLQKMPMDKRSQVAIISPVKKCRPNPDGSYTNLGLQLIANYLKKNGILYLQHYSLEGDELGGKKDNDELQRKEGHINLLTIHGSKGLEFEEVFLFNFHFSTFGRKPTQEQYNEFKYLWYVAISRAINKLYIYLDQSKTPWPELNKIPDSLYSIEGNKVYHGKITFGSKTTPEVYHITQFLGDPTLVTERRLYQIENKLNYLLVRSPLWEMEVDKSEFSKNEYVSQSPALYGNLMEELLTFLFHRENKTLDEYLEPRLEKIANILMIPENHQTGYNRWKSRFQALEGGIYLSDIRSFKDTFSDCEKDLLSYLVKKLEDKKLKPWDTKIYLYLESNVFDLDKSNDLEKKYRFICDNSGTPQLLEILMDIMLFWYHMEQEAKYLLQIDRNLLLQGISSWLTPLEYLAEEMVKKEWKWEWQVRTVHPNLPIVGIPDIVVKDLKGNTIKIIELKFVRQVSSYHVLQVLLYYNNMFPDWKNREDIELEVWNMQEGNKYVIEFNPDMVNYDILKWICDTLGIKMRNNVFLYDLETTGLDTSSCEIVERYIEEYSLGYCVSEGHIRPQQISQKVLDLLHLTLPQLMRGDRNLKKFKKEMEEVYEYHEKPIFIAHNGMHFDHPIMKRYGLLLREKTKFLDSRIIIRMVYHERDTWKMNLSEIYREIMKTKPRIAHQAKDDTLMIGDIFKKLKVSREDIIQIN